MISNFTKFSFVIVVLLTYLSSSAQVKYDLTSSSSVYNPLENAEQALAPDADWGYLETTISVSSEFEFDLFGVPTQGFDNLLSQSFLISDGIDLELDDVVISSLFFSFGELQNRALIAGNAPTQVAYATVGEVGTRIFKMEYANAGFINEIDELGTADMFTNFQLWFYEDSDCVEFRQGPSNITDSDVALDGQPIVFSLYSGTLENIFGNGGATSAIYAAGDPSNPTEGEIVNDDSALLGTLDDFPEEGQVYTFCVEGVTPPVSTRNVLSNLDWDIYPNPVEEILTIDMKDDVEGQISILSMDGVQVMDIDVFGGQQPIHVKNLTSGHYIAKFSSAQGFSIKRFFKG